MMSFLLFQPPQVSAATIQPVGKESSWNVDGELLSNNHISVEVQQACVDVFARGVELVAPHT